MKKEQPKLNWTYRLAITTMAFAIAGCSSAPKMTLSGEPIKQIPPYVEIPGGVVLVVAVCIPDKKVIMDSDASIRYSKIFKKSFFTRKLKLGYPQKRNDSYWLTNILGENGKIYGFVLPNDIDDGQRLANLWNLRDFKVDFKWSPWLKPDYKIDDISDYSKEDWGLVGKKVFDQNSDSFFLAKFRLISYREYMLEQINQWDLNPMEPCVAIPKKPLLIGKEEKKIQKQREIEEKESLKTKAEQSSMKKDDNIKPQVELKIESTEGLELNRNTNLEIKGDMGNDLMNVPNPSNQVVAPVPEAINKVVPPTLVTPSIKLPPRRILEPVTSVE